jgi:hypothetical protein
VALVGVGVLRADDQAEIRTIIEKVIQAAGGEAKFTGVKAMTWKSKEMFRGPRGAISGTRATSIQWPDQFWTEGIYEIEGTKTKRIMVLNGDKGWMKEGDRALELDNERVADLKERNYINELIYVPLSLKDKTKKLSLRGEVKVGDRTTVVLKVAQPNHRDAYLYFDKETWLPLKARMTRSAEGVESSLEMYFSDHKEVEGVKVPMKAMLKEDGRPRGGLEITEFKLLKQKLDDGVFAKP